MTVPMWISENYSGAERDFTDWMRDIARREIFADLIAETKDSPQAAEQTNAIVEYWVMSRTKEISQTTERAFIFQLYHADKTGWYHYLPGELDTIEELLASLLDDTQEGTSKYYDMKFIVEVVMPLMKKAGAKPEDVWGLPNAKSKARVAVPVLREIMRRAPDGENLGKDDLEEMFNVVRGISDQSQSYDEFKDQMYQMRGKGRTSIPRLPMTKYYMPKNEQWLLIKSPSPRQTLAIEYALKALIERIDVADPWALVNEVANLLPKSAKIHSVSTDEIVRILEEV